MKFLFIMNPLDTVVVETDTTLLLMQGAQEAGHEVYYVRENGLSLIDGKVYFQTTKVGVNRGANSPFIIEGEKRLSQDDIHAVFIRPNPPFDTQYLMNTWLLDQLPKKIAVINKANAIRTVNEKIWAAQFHDLVPPTIVSSNKAELLNFIAKHKNIIAKPANGFGGRSVFHIKSGDTNTKVALETLSDTYQEAIILQRYIPEAAQGDKRILLLNGEILGALMRVHSEDDHRNNGFAGGTFQPTIITDRDKAIVRCIGPQLRELGLYFVGIDILGDYLIEVNVTSPTCLPAMNCFYSESLEKKVIGFVEHLITAS